MKKRKKVLILDDSYWHYIFRELNWIHNDLSFPFRWNVIDPMKWYKYIVKSKPDYIIMSSWYQHNSYSTPKWISLLERLVWHYWKEISESSNFLWFKFNKSSEFKLSWFNSKIIYICDMWKLNTKKFSIFKYFDNIEFVQDKDINIISQIIDNN